MQFYIIDFVFQAYSKFKERQFFVLSDQDNILFQQQNLVGSSQEKISAVEDEILFFKRKEIKKVYKFAFFKNFVQQRFGSQPQYLQTAMRAVKAIEQVRESRNQKSQEFDPVVLKKLSYFREHSKQSQRSKSISGSVESTKRGPYPSATQVTL